MPAITLTQARDALVAAVHTTLTTSLPTLPVYYENTAEVDVNTVGDRFLQVNIDVEDVQLATVTSDLVDHVTGYIGLRLFMKAGTGTRPGLVIFDTLTAALRHRNLSGVHTGSCSPGKKEELQGWLIWDLGVPFEYWA